MAGSLAVLSIVILAGAAPLAATPKKSSDYASATVVDAMHRSGTITNGDYPASALRERAQGTSFVDLEIGADGRVTGCRVAGSSGNAALDSTACSLAQRRFRFTPARDAKGRNVAGRSRNSVDWRLPDETPLSPGPPSASD